jgi:hypothetical protein
MKGTEKIGSYIEIVAEHEHSVTLITKLTEEDAEALSRATEGILWFLLQRKGATLNPNADYFKTGKDKRSVPTHESGLEIFLDFNQGLIDAISEDDRDREELFIDQFVDRWEEEGPKKTTKKRG